MGTVSYQVKKVGELLEQRLAIPSYQRPYKWQPKHVNQLIDDVLTYRNKQSYHLGTAVLPKTVPLKGTLATRSSRAAKSGPHSTIVRKKAAVV